tara:strand:- start:511 stop:1356 length:846 start_codon:yes stop_codon:yes gene_type:complete
MDSRLRYIAPLFALLIFIKGCTSNSEWINDLPKPWKISEEEFTRIIPMFHKKFPDFHDRLKAFSSWQIGTPYKIFCLGEEIDPDPDPIFRLDVSDCTVHILTNLASIQSQSWEESKSKIIKIHYKENEKGIAVPNYKDRWHFTTDRIQKNPSTRDITRSVAATKDLERIDITLNEKNNGKEFLDLGWQRKTTAYFIPSDKISMKVMSNLPEVVGVAFVKRSYFKMGLVVAHEGIIVDQKDIIHASQEFEKTVQMNFMEYYFENESPRFDGIMLFSFHPLEV